MYTRIAEVMLKISTVGVLLFALIVGIFTGGQSDNFWGGLMAFIVIAAVGIWMLCGIGVLVELAQNVEEIRDQVVPGQVSASGIGLNGETDKARDANIIKAGGWKCRHCGKVNPDYTGTCSCGQSKY